MSNDPVPRLLSYLRPLWLLDVALTYALGAAIARYLGISLDLNRFLLGSAWLLSLQLGGHSLDLYFAQPASSRVNKSAHNQSLWTGVAALSTTALLTIPFVRTNILNNSIIFIMILLVGGMIVTTISPIRLIESVYRELMLSILCVVLVPAFAFLLQAGSLHRFVAMSVFPLMLLHTSALILFKFPTFYHDSQHEKQSLLVRTGWQHGMNIVNILILSAFLLLGFAMLMGLSPAIVWPTFFVLPLAIFQIWYLSRIAAGAKPHWKVLSGSAISLYAFTSYLMLFGFLTH
jgi:1,4-dihydroxy-2-naphthoate octaprenyltransferase